MSSDDYEATLDLQASADTVYQAVATRAGVAAWWTRDCAGGDGVGSTLTMNFPGSGFHATMRIDDLDPPRHVAWSCVDAEHPEGVSADRRDWIGTRITFDIEAGAPGQCRLRFAHLGLGRLECLGVCTDAWGFYLRSSLRQLVETGAGEPHGAAPG